MRRSFCIFPLLLISVWAQAEPVTLRHAVELALKHATAPEIAAADEQRAAAEYRELRDFFIPQLTTGAGLGWSYGFPLGLAGSAPSLFNLNAQSMLWNPSQRELLQAAKADSSTAAQRSKDQRNQTIQDTVLSYTELAKWEQRLERLHETQADAEKMEAAVAQRVKEGIDSELDAKKARLSSARVRLRVAEAQGSADVLREHLAKLTGLQASGIQTESDSLPAFPAEKDDSAPEQAAAASPAVTAAVEHARAQYLRAQAEHRALWPSVDFGAQYAVLSKFNNYENYYIPAKPCGQFLCVADTFRQNNATIGVNIRIPIFNAAQRARAETADADALKAKKQADAARNQVSEQTLRLQRAVAQMRAARDVADLEFQIAQKNLEAVQTRSDASGATIHDLDEARTQANERFMALQDATLELERSQVTLLRAQGELDHWALGTP